MTATAIAPSDKSTLTVSMLQSCEPNARKKMRRAKKKMYYYHDIITPFHSRGGGGGGGGGSVVKVSFRGLPAKSIEESSRFFVSVESTSNTGRRIPALGCQSVTALSHLVASSVDVPTRLCSRVSFLY